MTVNLKLLPSAVATSSADSKQAIFERLSLLLADAYTVPSAVVFEGLEERERLGSTGFGGGVAIPHARIEGLERPVAALLKLDAPVDFKAADGIPVDLVIGLLSPAHGGVAHLHALAAISRLVRNEAIHTALSQAESSEALFATLTNVVGSGIANDNFTGSGRESA